MEWIKINESPEGYEPVYSVIEKETGRDIAINLEKDEAILIENIQEMYNISTKLQVFVEEYYMNDDESSKEKLNEVNNVLTELELLLSKIKEESNLKHKI